MKDVFFLFTKLTNPYNFKCFKFPKSGNNISLCDMCWQSFPNIWKQHTSTLLILLSFPFKKIDKSNKSLCVMLYLYSRWKDRIYNFDQPNKQGID